MSKYGSFDIKGIEELQKAITEKYSGAKSVRIINSAVCEGTEFFAEELRSGVGAFRDKGHEQAEIVTTKPRKTADGRIAKIGWNGPKNRYAIVHLNEFGYTRKGRQYSPRGFGVIEKLVRSEQDDYFKAVEGKMRDLL